jgi:DNA helicase-2/ATP-dependent DNA helicase PcrA
MAITQVQYQTAQASQHAAAQDTTSQVRLVAGPGTGKSFSIGERVHWLLTNGVLASEIFAVSFTNASAEELSSGIANYLIKQKKYPNSPNIHVSTLHSLALSALTRANQLAQYPVKPVMLDEWAQNKIFDCEFADTIGTNKTRASEIRVYEESIWNTGAPPTPYISHPQSPITQNEITNFRAFHISRSTLYSCLLPGESVQKCVNLINAGILNPVLILNIKALIVDEFQDLNQCDQELVVQMSAAGVSVFVAGDDDQSIYAFRYGSPIGIQTFQNTYPNSTSHTLHSCFRCTPTVLSAADNVISAHAAPGRLLKQLSSAYSTSNPPVAGALHTWSFVGEAAEAGGIARSCQQLINAGVAPREILILLTKKIFSKRIEQELMALGIPFIGIGSGALANTNWGRFIVSFLKVSINPDYLIGYRTILGLLNRVGIRTCNKLANLCINNNVRYADVFLRPLPPWLNGTPLTAVNRIRGLLALSQGWTINDSLQIHAATLTQILSNNLTQKDVAEWQVILNIMPLPTTLDNLLSYLNAENDSQRQDVISTINATHMPPDEVAVPVNGDGVRLMTLHKSKGLSAQVVFIPALEESSLPSAQDNQFAGLVLQAARILYVGMTRARAALILSFAHTRPEFITRGRRINRTPSRFLPSVGQPFTHRNGGLTPIETNTIVTSIQNL